MAFSFRIDGVNRVGNKLRTLGAMNRNIIDPVGWQWAQDTRRKLKSTLYPPKRPMQKYVRTGQLANRWKVDRNGPGRWNITNLANRKGRFYAGYVVGERQAWMHKGRWWKARDVIEEEIPKLTKKLSDKIKSIWNG